MKIEERHSYGVLPIRREDGKYFFLLVNQKETAQKLDSKLDHWTFAKGTPEANESPVETALRETKEEVGLVFNDVKAEPSYTNSYSFHQDGKQINKQVTYFLGYTEKTIVSAQEEEIKTAEWFSYEDAIKRLTFKHTKLLLSEVDLYLNSLDK